MKIRSLVFAGLATFALALPALADDSRVATDPEQTRVTEALTKAGYDMVNSVRVDNDQFKAYAKKGAKDVEVTLDMSSLKVLKVEDVKK